MDEKIRTDGISVSGSPGGYVPRSEKVGRSVTQRVFDDYAITKVSDRPNEVEINIGCLSDGPEWAIRYNVAMKHDDLFKCKHVKDGRLPRVVVAENEGGYNSTWVCLDCILEVAKILEDDIFQ
jgi:hypothetical protein